MKINQLRCLLAIEKAGSISGAAEIMRVTVPAITKSMSNLEEEFDMPLIDRSAYRAGLNQYGKHLTSHAHAIIAAIDEAKQSLNDMRSQTEKRLVVETAPALAVELVPKAVVRLREVMPGAVVTFGSSGQSADANQLVENLLDGKSDLLICPLLNGMDLTGLYYEPLVRVGIKIVASKNHPALSLDKPSLKSLVQYDWITPALMGEALGFVKQFFADKGAPLPANIMPMPMRPALINMMKYGEFIVIMPCNEELFSTDEESLDVLDIDCSGYGWTHFIIERASGRKSEIHTQFINVVKGLLSPIEAEER